MEQGCAQLQGTGQRSRKTIRSKEVMADKQRGLGRGLDSLIPTQIVEAEFDVTAKAEGGNQAVVDAVLQVDPMLVDPNPHQPREYFDQEALDALAVSIRVHGIL